MPRLSVTSDGLRAKVSLDDTDISHSLRGLTVRYDTAGVPTAVLNVVLFQHSEVDADEVAVTVPEETAALLQRLGWTPPAADTTEGEAR